MTYRLRHDDDLDTCKISSFYSKPLVGNCKHEECLSTNGSVFVEAKWPMSDAVQLAIKFANSKLIGSGEIHIELPRLQYLSDEHLTVMMKRDLNESQSLGLSRT